MTRNGKLTATAALLVAGALTVGGVLYAQRGPGGGHWGPPGGFGRGPGGPLGLFSQLDLSQEQRDQVRAIFEGHKPEMQAAGEKLRDARSAQQSAASAIPVDEAQVRASSADVAAAESEMALLRGRIQNDVFEILTPDQQTKLRELQAQHEQRMNERRDRWRDRRPSTPPPGGSL